MGGGGEGAEGKEWDVEDKNCDVAGPLMML